MMSWRHALGAAGLLVAGAAVAAGHPVLVWVAIGLLVLSLGLFGESASLVVGASEP